MWSGMVYCLCDFKANQTLTEELMDTGIIVCGLNGSGNSALVKALADGKALKA